MVKDPVCGMEVDKMSAKHMAEFEGEDYYFCSEDCKHKFKGNPEKFIKK
ncbi:MAG: YHS domain-containing protein [Nanoarchaeota archaeon]|nr:YHS domain-containing protein [Nanoarchaeota archaeon]